MKIRRHLDIDDKLILRRIEDDIGRDQNVFKDYRENRIKWNEQINAKPGDVGEDGNRPDKIPETKIQLQKLQSRIFTSLWNTPIVVSPTDAGDVEKAEKSTKFLNALKKDHIPNCFDFFDEYTLTTISEGMSVSNIQWDKEERTNIDIKYYQIAKGEDGQPILNPETGEPINPETGQPITQEAIILELLPSPKYQVTDIKEKGEDTLIIKYKEHTGHGEDSAKDQWIDRECRIDFSVDEADGQIVVRIERPETHFEGVKLDVIDFDYFNCSMDGKQLQDLNHVTLEFEITVHELLQGRDKGYYKFSDEDLDKIRKAKETAKEFPPTSATQAEKEDEGIGLPEYPDHFAIVKGIKAFYKWDVEDKGYFDEVVFTIIPEAQVVIAKQYLSEVIRHNKRPYELAIWGKRKQSLLGIGLAEDLRTLNLLMNDWLNFIMDAGQFAIKPPGIYNSAGNMEVHNIEYDYGELIGIDGDITWMPSPANFPAAWEIIGFINTKAEMLGNVNAQISGQSGRVKTATQHMAQIRQALENMAVNFLRLKNGLERIFLQVYQLYQAYMPAKMKFRIIGDSGKIDFDEITREELISHPDIHIDINFEEASREYLVEMWTMILDRACHPIVLQAGLVNKMNLYNIYKKWYEATGQKDIHNYLTKPMEPEPSVDPEVENGQMFAGAVANISELDNHQEHLKRHQTSYQKNMMFMSPQIQSIYQRHSLQHIQALQAQMQEQQLLAQMAAGGMRGGQPGQSSGNQPQGRIAMQQESPQSVVPMGAY